MSDKPSRHKFTLWHCATDGRGGWLELYRGMTRFACESHAAQRKNSGYHGRFLILPFGKEPPDSAATSNETV